MAHMQLFRSIVCSAMACLSLLYLCMQVIEAHRARGVERYEGVVLSRIRIIILFLVYHTVRHCLANARCLRSVLLVCMYCGVHLYSYFRVWARLRHQEVQMYEEDPQGYTAMTLAILVLMGAEAWATPLRDPFKISVLSHEVMIHVPCHYTWLQSFLSSWSVSAAVKRDTGPMNLILNYFRGNESTWMHTALPEACTNIAWLFSLALYTWKSHDIYRWIMLPAPLDCIPCVHRRRRVLLCWQRLVIHVTSALCICLLLILVIPYCILGFGTLFGPYADYWCPSMLSLLLVVTTKVGERRMSIFRKPYEQHLAALILIRLFFRCSFGVHLLVELICRLPLANHLVPRCLEYCQHRCLVASWYFIPIWDFEPDDE